MSEEVRLIDANALEEIPKQRKFSTYSMDITFDKELTQEEMEKLLFRH